MNVPKVAVGTTLSQRGLALRANHNVSTIRRRGDRVKVSVTGYEVAWRETWNRQVDRVGRTAGYILVEIET